jgi:hypothetical protein
MPTGQTFGQVVSATQEEAGHFSSAALNTTAALHTNVLSQVKRAVRRTYRRLHADHNWPHLYTYRDVDVETHSRTLTFPPDMDPDRNIEAWILPAGEGSNWAPLDYGIGMAQMQQVNSDRFDFADSDTYHHASTEAPSRWSRSPVSPLQFEVWPITLTAGAKIRFWGLTKPKDLLEDGDFVDLDDDLVALFAAAEFLERQGSPDAGSKLEQAMAHYRRLRANTQNPVREYRLNPGRERWTGIRVETPRR